MDTAVIFYLTSEDQVSELCESQEEDEEHDCEAGQVFSALAQRHGHLADCFVEGDVLEYLW